MARNDPFRNFKFRLEIDEIQQAGFSEVTMAETMTEAVDYRNGNDPSFARKLDGLTKFGNVTLKWGMTTSIDLYNWYKSIMDGQIQANRKMVIVVVQDESGTDRARFRILEAWPTKYVVGALNGTGNEVLIETLELVNEGVHRIA